MSGESTDPTQPLREVLTDEQIKYIRDETDHENIESILNSSLNEIMQSASKPDLTQLMGQATDQFDVDNSPDGGADGEPQSGTRPNNKSDS